jgi:hypothetical protein
LALVYLESNRPARAAEVFAVSLQRASERFGQDSGQAADASLPLAYAQEEAGNLTEAEALYRSAAATAESLAGPTRPATAHCLLQLGAFLAARERWADAEPLLVRARDIWDMVGDEASLTAAVDRLVTVYRATEQPEAALAAVERYAKNVARFRDSNPGAVAEALERQLEIMRWAGHSNELVDRLARRAAILRASDERRGRQAKESEEHRQLAMRPVVSSLTEVLADARPQTS